MDIKIELSGLDSLESRTVKVREMIAQELRKGMQASVLKIEAEAKRSIATGKKTGAIYKRRTVTHQASAAGEAPANDTGRLLNSIRGALEPYVSGALSAKVTVGASYGKLLEFGTRHMQPRPFLLPAAESSKKWIQDRLSRAVQTGINRGTGNGAS